MHAPCEINRPAFQALDSLVAAATTAQGGHAATRPAGHPTHARGGFRAQVAAEPSVGPIRA